MLILWRHIVNLIVTCIKIWRMSHKSDLWNLYWNVSYMITKFKDFININVFKVAENMQSHTPSSSPLISDHWNLSLCQYNSLWPMWHDLLEWQRLKWSVQAQEKNVLCFFRLRRLIIINIPLYSTLSQQSHTLNANPLHNSTNKSCELENNAKEWPDWNVELKTKYFLSKYALWAHLMTLLSDSDETWVLTSRCFMSEYAFTISFPPNTWNGDACLKYSEWAGQRSREWNLYRM